MIHKFRIGLLNATIAVSFDEDKEKARAELGRWACVEIQGHEIAAAYTIANCRRVAIWLGPQAERRTVFHECFHAVYRLLSELGCSGSDEELNATIFEEVVEKVLRLWQKNKEEKKVKKKKNG